MKRGLRLIAGITFTVLFLGAGAGPAMAALADREALERGISANKHALLKAQSELKYLTHDPKRVGQLKNKITLLTNDIQLKERRLEIYSMKAGDWMRLTDAAREKYLSQAEMPSKVMDSITLYVMGHPGELSQPLENILTYQSFRYRRSAESELLS